MSNSVELDSGSYRRIKVIAEQAVLSLIVLTSLLTTLAALWIVQKIGIAEPQINQPFSDANLLSRELLIDRNIIVDMLGIQSNLKTKRIVSDRIKIIGPPDQNKESSQMTLDSESIQMSANSFTTEDKPYEIRVSRKVVNLDVTNAIRRIKIIGAKNSGNLNLVSKDELELSGNLGLKAHGRAIRFQSPKDISFTSKDESITISAAKGLFLNIMHLEDFHDKYDKSDNNIPVPEQSSKHHLCISKVDGMVFAGSCE